ncbi:MAG: Secretion system C-terminal sorting domain [Bacteroidota bacterium]|jgi:hypothetical protein
MLKRLMIIACLIFGAQAQAQFTIDEDTLYAYGYAAKTNNGFSDINAHTIIRSKSMGIDTFVWKRLNVVKADPSWETAICDINACKPPTTNQDTCAFANVGDTGVFSFHLYAKDKAGDGSMTVRIYNKRTPLNFVDVVIFFEAWAEGSVRSNLYQSMKVFPNPVKSVLSINNAMVQAGTITVINAVGQTIHTQAFNGQLELNCQAFQAGVYTIMIQSQAGNTAYSFIKE